MITPDLAQLPPAPHGRQGWPWTIETPRLPPTRPDGSPWPRISILVASLDQAAFVEEMLRSVLLQGYPDLELIFMDGGSTDGTLDVVARYRPWIAHYESGPDRGQSHAFNKGLVLATGALFNIFDTDDIFLPGALAAVAQVHASYPGHVISGDVLRTWEGRTDHEIHFARPLDLEAAAQWWINDHHGQPGIYYPTALRERVGPIEESLHFLMDYDLTLRYLEHTDLVPVHAPTALIRVHARAKSSASSDYFSWDLAGISPRYQRRFPAISAEADRHLAIALFSAGCLRLLRARPDAWAFLRRGFSLDPWAAATWLFPGVIVRRIRRFFR